MNARQWWREERYSRLFFPWDKICISFIATFCALLWNMLGSKEAENSLGEHPHTWAQFFLCDWGDPTQVTGTYLSQLPTSEDHGWEALCLHLIALVFATNLTALCTPEPGIYHLTSVFNIYRVSTLGMTLLFHNCDPRENQGLHMLCPHCQKCFPFNFLGNLSMGLFLLVKVDLKIVSQSSESMDT